MAASWIKYVSMVLMKVKNSTSHISWSSNLFHSLVLYPTALMQGLKDLMMYSTRTGWGSVDATF